MNSPYIILEKAVHGKRTFPENTEAYVQSPMFVRLLTMISDVDRISSMRYTDTLTDFTTGIIWPKDWNIFTPPNKKHDFFELVYVYEGTLKLRIEQQIYAFEKGSVFSLDLHLRSALMPSRYSAFFLGISKDFFQMPPLNTNISFACSPIFSITFAGICCILLKAMVFSCFRKSKALP